jgi:hypothetical protein
MAKWCYDARLSHTTFRPTYAQTFHPQNYGTLALPAAEDWELQIHTYCSYRRRAPSYRAGRRPSGRQRQPIHGGNVSSRCKAASLTPHSQPKNVAPLASCLQDANSHMSAGRLQGKLDDADTSVRGAAGAASGQVGEAAAIAEAGRVLLRAATADAEFFVRREAD